MDIDELPKIEFDPPLGFSAVPCKTTIENACSLCLRLAEHDVTIKQASEISGELLLTRAALLQAFNHQHAAVIRSLAVELVCRIFEAGLAGPLGTHIFDFYDPENRRSRWRKEPQAPLVFGMVCHHWRTISVSNPHLWSAVPVRLDCRNVELELEVLSSWIHRSHPLPLYIGVSHQYEYGINGNYELNVEEDDDIKWEKIIGLVNSVSSRWDCLRLRLPPAALPLVTGSGLLDCPLRELYLESLISDYEWLNQEPCMMGTCKPKPTVVHLSKVAVRDVGIDWSNAREVTASAHELNEFVDLLLDAPELRKLTISTTSDDIIDKGRPKVLHSKLQALTIEDNRNTFGLFDWITLPALRSAEININDFQVYAFIEMLSRSGEPLTSLKVDTYIGDEVRDLTLDPPTVEISPLLQEIPSLKELWIDGCNRIDIETYLEVFRTLSQPDDEGRNFLPNLEKLHIRWDESFSKVGWEILPRILAMSSKPLSLSSSGDEAAASSRLGRPLHSLTVIDGWRPSLSGDPALRFPGTAIADELKGFVQRGFKVSIVNVDGGILL